MRIRLFMLFITTVLIFAGCGQRERQENSSDGTEETEPVTEYVTEAVLENIEEQKTSKPIAEYEDCRAVIDDNIFFLKLDWNEHAGDTIIIDAQIMKADMGGWDPYPNAKEMAKKAPDIVVGKVLDVSYTDQIITESGNTAATIYSFAVSEVLKGDDIREETIITILEYQGYIRRSVKKYAIDSGATYHVSDDRVFYRQRYTGEPMIEAGDEYVLFLKPYKFEFADGIIYRNELLYQGKYIKNPYGLYEKYIWEYEGFDHLFYKRNPQTGEKELLEPPMTLEELRGAVTSQSE